VDVDPSRLELCTEQTDETHRLFNDPHVSTSVGVRAAGTFLAPGQQPAEQSDRRAGWAWHWHGQNLPQ
jgi:hypothetical protein